MDTVDSKSEILNSWKEVAEYLGRGTRTVQRWEQALGLPVRRPRGKRRSAVMALRQDLESWVRTRPQINHESMPPGQIPIPSERVTIGEAIRTSRGLRTQNRQLRAEMSLALHSLVSVLVRIRTNQNGYGSAVPLDGRHERDALSPSRT